MNEVFVFLLFVEFNRYLDIILGITVSIIIRVEYRQTTFKHQVLFYQGVNVDKVQMCWFMIVVMPATPCHEYSYNLC